VQYVSVTFILTPYQSQTFGQVKKKTRKLIGLWNIAKLMLLYSLSGGRYE
jgi:hypothetical protein